MRVTIPTDHVTRAVMQAIGDLYVVEVYTFFCKH